MSRKSGSSSQTTCYVIAYDIPDDRRRTKVHQILMGFGKWTQYSLFKCLLSRKGVIDIGHIGPIPSTVSPHVCIDFVNSEFADHLSGATTFDRLAMPEWRRWFLARCGLPTTVRLGGRMRSAAVELRTLLRDLLAGGRLPRDAEMARLNRHLRRVLLQRRATRRGPRIELRSTWRPDGWPAALATVVLGGSVRTPIWPP